MTTEQVPLAAQIEKVQREIRYAQEDRAERGERLWSAVLASLQQYGRAMAVVEAARRARKSMRLLIQELSEPGTEALAAEWELGHVLAALDDAASAAATPAGKGETG